MSAAMAGFTMNDAITKAVSSEMNFGQIMLVRGVVAIALIAALAWHQGALRPLRTLMVKPVALRVVGEVLRNHVVPGGDRAFAVGQYRRDLSGAAIGDHFRRRADFRRAGWLAALAGDHGRLHRCPDYRSAGGRGLQPVFAAGAGFGGVLRRARSRDQANPRAASVAVHHPGDDRDDDDHRRRHSAAARRLDAAIRPLARPAGVAAVLLLIGYQCIIMALRSGDISAVAPFRYSALLWAMLLGYLVFGDVPDAMMVTGASIIVLSGLYAFYRERHASPAGGGRRIRPATGRAVIGEDHVV